MNRSPSIIVLALNPQRAGLYMGISFRHSQWFLGLHADEITIAEQFKKKDYKAFMIGKWHLGTEPEMYPKKQGFDSYYGAPCNMGHSPKFYDEEELVYEKTPLEKLTDLYTGRAVKIISENADSPFFMYFAHNYPHVPFKAGPKFMGSSGNGVRGDIIQELDWGIGEIMKALKEAGIADNTIFIFSSDNGPLSRKYAQPYRGTKYVSLEGGHRVPFIVHWPAGIKKAAVSEVPVVAMDLFPTLSEVIGASMPSDRIFDGISLTPIFKGKAIDRTATEPFYYYNCENLQAIRVGDWKMHLPRTPEQLPMWAEERDPFKNLKTPILYNLRADEGESQDVASKNPEVVQMILKMAESIRKELGEYMQRGSGQRATGSVIPDAPIISHPKDWKDGATKEMQDKIKNIRAERHPEKKRGQSSGKNTRKERRKIIR